MKLEHNNEIIEYTIEYKKRKSVELLIDPTGVVRIKAPKGTEEERIEKFVKSKGDWILKKTKEMFEPVKKITARTYEEGSKFLYLGKEYPIAIQIDTSIKKAEASFQNETFTIVGKTGEEDEVKTALEKFYRKKCRQKIKKRADYYQKNCQKLFKVKYKEIAIKEEKGRWASCSSERNMNFNWRLIMAPDHVIDYIVVHEMCHLAHMNHSKSFWTLVGKIMPDHEKRSDWLKYHGYKIFL